VHALVGLRVVGLEVPEELRRLRGPSRKTHTPQLKREIPRAVILLEVPDDTTATGIGLAIAAGGAFSPTATITRLLTGQEWLESLRKAQGSQYQPAR